jgi:putative MATE family efflux protein
MALRLHRIDALDREIAALAVPALASLIAEPLYLLVDTAVVGHLGTADLGGLSVASNILLVGFSICIFLAYGTTSVVSRLVGAGDHAEAAHQTVQSLWLALGIGVAFGTAAFVFAEPLVRLFGASAEVSDLAVLYLRVSTFGVPALLLALTGTGYFRGQQDTKTPLVIAIVAAGANLVLEVVLIYGFGLGLGASALTTVVAQWGSAAYYLFWIGRSIRAIPGQPVRLRPDLVALRALTRLSAALATRTAALRGSLLVGTMVAARLGNVELAAYEIAFALWSLLANALDAIAIAGQAMIGHRLGSGDADSARTASNRMVWWGIWTGLVSMVGLLVLQPWLPELFSSDAEVVALAGFLILLVALLQPVAAIVFVLDGILIGAGDLTFLAKAMVGAFAAYLPCALAVLWLDLGIGWLWGAIAVLMFARLIVLGVRYLGDRWLVLGATAR